MQTAVADTLIARIRVEVFWLDGDNRNTWLYSSHRGELFNAEFFRLSTPVQIVDEPNRCEVCEEEIIPADERICPICWAERPDGLRQYATPDDLENVQAQDRVLLDILCP